MSCFDRVELHPQSPAEKADLARAEDHAATCAACAALLRALRDADRALAEGLRGSGEASACPDARELAAWIDGGRKADPSLEAHLASCVECREDLLEGLADDRVVERRVPARPARRRAAARPVTAMPWRALVAAAAAAAIVAIVTTLGSSGHSRTDGARDRSGERAAVPPGTPLATGRGNVSPTVPAAPQAPLPPSPPRDTPAPDAGGPRDEGFPQQGAADPPHSPRDAASGEPSAPPIPDLPDPGASRPDAADPGSKPEAPGSGPATPAGERTAQEPPAAGSAGASLAIDSVANLFVQLPGSSEWKKSVGGALPPGSSLRAGDEAARFHTPEGVVYVQAGTSLTWRDALCVRSGLVAVEGRGVRLRAESGAVVVDGRALVDLRKSTLGVYVLSGGVRFTRGDEPARELATGALLASTSGRPVKVRPPSPDARAEDLPDWTEPLQFPRGPRGRPWPPDGPGPGPGGPRRGPGPPGPGPRRP